MTNFIFILADDLGYADLGCYGGRRPVSPNLDRMAARGIRFTQGYSNSPVCSPTRFGLITGRYQYRLRGAAEEPMTGRFRGSTEIGLPPAHPTLPSLLRERGYRTALIGKWHLGYPPHFGPEKSGYEYHIGPLSGGVSYFSHVDRMGKHDLVRDGEPVNYDGHYLTDLLTDEAETYLRARAGDRQPFLLSLHYTAPHWPWETRAQGGANPDTDQDIRHLDGGSVHIYGEMIKALDEGCGRVLKALDDLGLADDTVVIFTSDNGGERFSDTWPLVGGKMDLTEGGIRVPYIVQWGDRIAPGSVSAQHCMTMDWTATMLDIAGVPAHPGYPFDGVSMLPVLREPAHEFPRELFWRMNYRGQRALRDGPWKYLAIEGNEYLFDLSADERERANLALRQPERLARMRGRCDDWDAVFGAIPADARSELVYTEKDMPSR
ncbi:sulfatase-like hydrolase/transferase [Pigmentiphaga sp.]|uniref:sulfatase family protein n=1 Tax=Pigmentiphaga sp. TaxID=1977564 RepID=UPI00128B30F4|nr:sulfatase-like hydrolase/transferase [Pigmentiphaga sp.]MPS28693.1 twin-arginine translocation pathway signal protein [Alcaligenaceae bacterium SAGV5]MPS52476.1 twin-arginine translocation pathway signal protein [Alcaligenaceae bacterium SAGV3]MPT57684.1 twin-arginine translocation pathway signal protein [Alcaligenaceae bacterium]